MPPHEVCFIFNSPSSAGINSPQNRLTRSHAARSAHARARRVRTLEYQARKNREDQRHLDVKVTRGNTHSGPELKSSLPAGRRDPFGGFALPLKPIEELLFHHYVTIIVPLMHCNASDDLFTERMIHGWIPLAVSEQSLFHVTILASCRNLANRYTGRPEQQLFDRLAFQYKLMILQSLRESITVETSHFSDSTVSKALMLAYDKLFVHDEKMLKHHVEGAVQMVALKVAPQTLGLCGLMARLLSNLLAKVILEVGIAVTIPWDITAVLQSLQS